MRSPPRLHQFHGPQPGTFPDPGFPLKATVAARDLQLRCTRSRTRICDLLSELTYYNQALWHLGLQLREDARDNLGELRVAVVPGISRGTLRGTGDANTVLAAKNLLRHLLDEHQCVIALQVTPAVSKTAFLIDAIAARPRRLRRLAIPAPSNDEPQVVEGLFKLVASLDGVEALEFLDDWVGSDTVAVFPETRMKRMVAGLQMLELAELDGANDARNRELIDALVKNDTIKELSVGASVYTAGPIGRSSEWFAEYLTKPNPTLRKLTLRGRHSEVTCGLETLVRAISVASTLEDLVAHWHARTPECATLLRGAASSETLRSFGLYIGPCCEESVHRPQVLSSFATEGLRPWIQPLKKNRSLRNLSLDLSWFDSGDFFALLRVLSTSQSLDVVTVRNLPDDGFLESFCRNMRQCRPKVQIIIENHSVGWLDLQTLQGCPELTAVTLTTGRLNDADLLRSALGKLATCKHLTSIRLVLNVFDEMLHDAVATYIRSASEVRDIDLSLLTDCSPPVGDVRRVKLERNIIQALSSNGKITRIKLQTRPLYGEDYLAFADAVLKNRRLYELSVRASRSAFGAVFMRRLLSGLETNYSLLHLDLPRCEAYDADMAAAQDITRRNRSLVERASRFVMGDRDPYCAGAIELVPQHPKLVEIVKQKAGVTEAAAVDMIKNALQVSA